MSNVLNEGNHKITAKDYPSRVNVWKPALEALGALFAIEVEKYRGTKLGMDRFQIMKALNKDFVRKGNGQHSPTKLQRSILGKKGS